VHGNISPGFHGVDAVSARQIEGAVLVIGVVGNAESLLAAWCSECIWSVFCRERLDKGVDAEDGEEFLDDVAEAVGLGVERFGGYVFPLGIVLAYAVSGYC
jgi:hypothetical protein